MQWIQIGVYVRQRVDRAFFYTLYDCEKLNFINLRL